MNIDAFAKWLETNTSLKTYSVGRYLKAIDTIISDLDSYGLEHLNLFNLSDTAYIDIILD